MRRVAAAVVLVLVLGAASVAGARSKDGSFTKTFKAGDITYKVRGTPIANAPSLERVTVEAVRFGRVLASVAVEQSDPVAEARLANLDAVGAPELLIVTASAGSGAAGGLVLFELRGDAFARAEPPPLRAELLAGYLGHDRFGVEEGLVVRRFPRFAAGDPDCCPTGGEVELRYAYRDGKLVEVVPR